jgi:hypothetical protein
MTDSDLAGPLERYIGAWNEPNPARRTETARELWAADGAVINAGYEYRGHEAVVEAIARSYEREMLDPEDSVDSAGANFLLLDQDRRIWLDYQFVER